MKNKLLFRCCLILLTVFVFYNATFAERYVVLVGPTQQEDSYTRGYLGSDNICHWASTSVSWYLNSAGAGDGLTFNQTQSAVSSAYSAWQSVSTATITFSYSGSTSSEWAVDGKNVHFWAEDGDDIYDYIDYTVAGVTIVSINQNEEFTDVDIVYNGDDYAWKVDGTSMDIQSIATHEIGHKIGLHHSDVTSSTMYGRYHGPTSMRSLESDDEVGVSFLYRGNIIDNESLYNTNNYFNWNVTVYSSKTLTMPSGKTLYLRGNNITNNGTLTVSGTLSPTIKRSGASSNYYGMISNAFSASGSGETIDFQSGTCNETADITVPSGKTLELDAGVTLKMASGKEIIIQGSLVATGTSGSKITFTKSGASDWKGIKIDNANNITMEHCIIRYANNYGIKVYNSNSFTLKNSEIEHINGSGVLFDGSESGYLEDNYIHGCD